MSLNKKILAVAIVGGLFATTANAAVTLGSSLPAPVTVATEAFGTADAAGTDFTNAGNALDIITPFNYSFSAGEVRYARIECGSNVKFATAAVSATTAAAGNTFGAINGIGTNAISFSVTAGATPVLAANTFTINGTRNISAGAAASCTYGLYDQPSQAQAGGTIGRIATANGAYINFASGYAFSTNSQQTLTANVEADTGAFTKFTAAGPVSDILGRLTNLRFDAAFGDQIDENGTDITLGAIFGAGTSISFAGDFSYITGTTGVFLASNAGTCAASIQNSTTRTSAAASFTVGSTAHGIGVDEVLCVVPNTTGAIPEGSYTATLNAVVSNAAEYSVSSTGPSAAGSIVRNGTSLQAPLAQVPGGYLSRLVLTNTGSLPRPFTITVFGETGNTIGTANLTGTVPANGTLVRDLNTVLTSFTAGQATRATLNVTVAGPNNQIQGLYQIVNPASGSVSNHVMVRPGTN